MNESDARADVDDRARLQRMAQGDRAALATLYNGYHGRLCRFLSRLTRRQDIIEEVVNDCFWIACRQAGDFRVAARVSTRLIDRTSVVSGKSETARVELGGCRHYKNKSYSHDSSKLIQ